MTQQEFQDLTGRKVTEEEYRNIEKMYVNNNMKVYQKII